MDKEKCEVIKGGRVVEPCKALSDACEFGNPRGKQKGLWAWTYHKISRPTGEGPSRQFFGVKSGEFVEKGVAFRFCPFCGERIDAPFMTPNAEVSGAGTASAGLPGSAAGNNEERD